MCVDVLSDAKPQLLLLLRREGIAFISQRALVEGWSFYKDQDSLY